jgi:hypothetical protein
MLEDVMFEANIAELLEVATEEFSAALGTQTGSSSEPYIYTQ